INLRPPLGSLTVEDWDATMAVNLTAPFLLGQRFGPDMAERGWGRIVNVTSQQASRAFANSGGYGASKGGVASLTRSQSEACAASAASVGAARQNDRYGRTTRRYPRAARGFRREYRRHRCRRGDARQLPRVRLQRHLLPGAPRRAGRPQAGAAPDPVPDERDGAAPGSFACEMRPGRRRGDGPAAPARRLGHLRRAGPDGPAVGDAAAAGRRA